MTERPSRRDANRLTDMPAAVHIAADTTTPDGAALALMRPQGSVVKNTTLLHPGKSNVRHREV
jgi:hypothetical protein